MHAKARAVPDGYHSLTPYIAAPSADSLIAFLAAAFDATTRQRKGRPDGSVAHAEVQIGDSVLMICDANDSHPAAPASFYLYVADTDEHYRRALDAGARSLMEPADTSYGDRNAGVIDPAGNQWWLATRLA